MAAKIFGQQQDGGHVYGLDRLRAAVIMHSVCQSYQLKLKDSECCQLCVALCLPQMTKEDFLNYWDNFSQEVPFLRRYVFHPFFPPRYTRKQYFLTIPDCILLCVFAAQRINLCQLF